jgi:hypothetical protein
LCIELIPNAKTYKQTAPNILASIAALAVNVKASSTPPTETSVSIFGRYTALLGNFEASNVAVHQ